MKILPYVLAFVSLSIVGACAEPTTPAGERSIDIVGPAELVQNQGFRFLATIRDEDGDPVDGAIEWSTSSPFVATIDADGRVTALRPGTTRIGARAGALDGVLDLEVRAGAVASIVDFELPATLEVGEWLDLDPAAFDGNGERLLGREVELRSGNVAVAAIRNSRLTALGVGSATIHARAGGYEDSLTIAVVPAVEPTYEGTLNIVAVDGVRVTPHDTVLVTKSAFGLTIRVALAADESAPDFIILEDDTGLQWSAIQGIGVPGDTVEVTMPVTGPVIGVSAVRVVGATIMEGPTVFSEPVYLKSPTPYLQARIKSIDGVAVNGGVTTVADRFDVVLEIEVPAGATIPVDMMGVRATLPELDYLNAYLGVAPNGALVLGPGTHEFAFTTYVAPPGRRTLRATVVHGARHITVDEVEVDISNSDVTSPTVSAFGGADTVVVAVPDPLIVVDLADQESGLFGVSFDMHWQIVDGGFLVGPCASSYLGYFLGGVVHQTEWPFRVSECFGFRLNHGANPMTLGAYDNALNRGTTPLVLVYDFEAEGGAHGVRIGPDGARALSAAEVSRIEVPSRDWRVLEESPGRALLVDDEGAVARHTSERRRR